MLADLVLYILNHNYLGLIKLNKGDYLVLFLVIYEMRGKYKNIQCKVYYYFIRELFSAYDKQSQISCFKE